MKVRRRRTLLASVAASLVALVVLAPTGAEAAPFSLKASASDGVVSGSCDFSVSRYNPSNTGPSTITAKVTAKAAEVKSFLAPRKVAYIEVFCSVYPANALGEEATLFASNHGSTLYKSRYVQVVQDTSYHLCVSVGYIRKDGVVGGSQACNPPFEVN